MPNLETITINNIKNCRKFGWGYSTDPSGQGTNITPPSMPDYSGTLKTIARKIANDKTYNSLKNNALMSIRWFYDKKPIHSTLKWGQTNASESKPEYGYGWVNGLDLDGDEVDITIRVEAEQ